MDFRYGKRAAPESQEIGRERVPFASTGSHEKEDENMQPGSVPLWVNLLSVAVATVLI